MKPKIWDKHLNAALCAYRTSFKNSLGFTPFHLVYGQEALLPIQVELASLRVLAKCKGDEEKEWFQQHIIDLERLELDREEAINHYIQQAEKRKMDFNKKISKKDIY